MVSLNLERDKAITTVYYSPIQIIHYNLSTFYIIEF